MLGISKGPALTLTWNGGQPSANPPHLEGPPPRPAPPVGGTEAQPWSISKAPPRPSPGTGAGGSKAPTANRRHINALTWHGISGGMDEAGLLGEADEAGAAVEEHDSEEGRNGRHRRRPLEPQERDPHPAIGERRCLQRFPHARVCVCVQTCTFVSVYKNARTHTRAHTPTPTMEARPHESGKRDPTPPRRKQRPCKLCMCARARCMNACTCRCVQAHTRACRTDGTANAHRAGQARLTESDWACSPKPSTRPVRSIPRARA